MPSASDLQAAVSAAMGGVKDNLSQIAAAKNAQAALTVATGQANTEAATLRNQARKAQSMASQLR
jgi:hypothetical protein